VWIAPRPLAGPARSLLTAAGLDGYVTWFGAQHLTDVDVATWWDLDSLRAHYESFLDVHRRSLGVTEQPDEQAFAADLLLVDAWRLLPRIDPGLPATLLPPGWPAPAAFDVFRTLHDRWTAAGLRHVRSIVSGG
jgi:phenylacetic acid degradation operon negative regulatory protein